MSSERFVTVSLSAVQSQSMNLITYSLCLFSNWEDTCNLADVCVHIVVQRQENHEIIMNHITTKSFLSPSDHPSVQNVPILYHVYLVIIDFLHSACVREETGHRW